MQIKSKLDESAYSNMPSNLKNGTKIDNSAAKRGLKLILSETLPKAVALTSNESINTIVKTGGTKSGSSLMSPQNCGSKRLIF